MSFVGVSRPGASCGTMNYLIVRCPIYVCGLSRYKYVGGDRHEDEGVFKGIARSHVHFLCSMS